MENTSDVGRGQWTSRGGFILAAAGSAIGLGNIWRFPYTAGENGGGAFVMIYLLFVALIGTPVLLAELSVGRATQRNSVGAFKALAPKTLWPWLGRLGVLTGFGILSFYSVIASFTLGYIYMTVTGRFADGIGTEQSQALFDKLSGHPAGSVLLLAAFMLLTALVVRRGISSGIERAAKILMPVFFVFLVVLACRSLTLEGAGEGLRFLFAVDFSKITPAVAGVALGQALFSLSLGMGTMITYGSYLPKQENLPIAGLSVAFFDTLIALLAGMIIFPALFHAGASPDAGTGLVFVVMPTIFDAMPAGTLFALGFYVLLAIAALTSTMSLLEVIVAYFVDERGWTREKTVWVVSGLCFLVAVPSALSYGASPYLTTMLSTGFLGLMNIVFGNYALSIGALFICLFVGWRWKIAKARAELEAGGHRFPDGGVWGFLVRFVCPVAVILILAFIIFTGEYF
ncbi:MAG: sodium-dependent transporter [bacterium]|nr:sodium-dependent transporter [bacterium]